MLQLQPDPSLIELQNTSVFTGKAELFGGEAGLRGVDYIFEANNSVLVAAAATGLKQSPGQMTGGMTIEASVLNCSVYKSTWFIVLLCSLLASPY